MAGHSKFANIKHKKAKNDAKRGKIFTKLGREIAVAIKEGGANPELNRKLADVIAKAKSNNMPNDTIDKAIKKAAGDKDGASYENIVYEGYGPSGVAIIVETLTDNKNRTAGNVRSYFTKGNGNMGTSGCVGFMFDKKGQIMIERSDDIDEEELLMIALEAGADDMKVHEEGFEILTVAEEFSVVNKSLEEAGIEMVSAEIKMIPQTLTVLEAEEDIKSMNKLIDLLEDDDDVQNIWHNWDE
ncbi:MAG: YebC/PmpR family DNA-binding transcriptional regulator [Clostridia bacterium]|jgi:YebC/PmpR family DNA-binding regulatory protein|nr:YebC/PmpR family DNA-binding transcriptional regulator [Clostridia bacterium]